MEGEKDMGNGPYGKVMYHKLSQMVAKDIYISCVKLY